MAVIDVATRLGVLFLLLTCFCLFMWAYYRAKNEMLSNEILTIEKQLAEERLKRIKGFG